MHSAAWDASYNLAGKTVAVIGGGSSAVQIIPSIQPKVKKLIPFLRSPVWITAGFGAKYAAPGGVNFNCRCLYLKILGFLTRYRQRTTKVIIRK
jgi:cation diffusion facilitator CzcD-associated flavoprotein CzcO